jgi:hypothetical protein
MSQDDHTALIPPDDSFTTLVNDLRTIIRAGQGKAAAAINAEMVQTYWQIGERIVREEQGGEKRAAYGEQVLTRLGQRLGAEFGRGFTKRSLEMMRQFFLTYPIANALRSQIELDTLAYPVC